MKIKEIIFASNKANNLFTAQDYFNYLAGAISEKLHLAAKRPNGLPQSRPKWVPK